jgi:hypothetical protein
VAGLCVVCCAGAGASLPADASVVPAPGHVAVAAMPPSDSDLPHVPDGEFPTHVPSSNVSAGGGGVVQPSVRVSGEGHLETGGPVPAGAALFGSGTLTAGGKVQPAAMLSGERGSPACWPGVNFAQRSRWPDKAALLSARAGRLGWACWVPRDWTRGVVRDDAVAQG